MRPHKFIVRFRGQAENSVLLMYSLFCFFRDFRSRLDEFFSIVSEENCTTMYFVFREVSVLSSLFYVPFYVAIKDCRVV